MLLSVYRNAGIAKHPAPEKTRRVKKQSEAYRQPVSFFTSRPRPPEMVNGYCRLLAEPA